MPKILVSDAPLSQGAPVREVDADAFARKLKIKWADNAVNSKVVRVIPETNQKAAITQKNLVICKKGDIGYGVFAKQLIPKGSVIGVYASHIHVFFSDEELNQYYQNNKQSYILEVVNVALSQDAQYKNTHLIYDANGRGNITRFMNHAPAEAKLKKEFVIAESIKKDIATANVVCKMAQSQDTILPSFVADRDILPEEELLWDYGDQYWSKLGKKLILFNKKGENLNPFLYQSLFVDFRIEKKGTLTVPSEALCVLKEHQMGVHLLGGITVEREALANKLVESNSLFSVGAVFNQLSVDTAKSLYYSPKCDIQSKIKPFEGVSKYLALYFSSKEAPCVIEFMARRANDLEQQRWPIDMIFGVKTPDECRFIEDFFAHASILTVNLDNKYIILPHVNSEHMVGCLNRVVQTLPDLKQPVSSQAKSSIPVLSEYIEEQQKIKTACCVIKESNLSLFTKPDMTLYQTAVDLYKNAHCQEDYLKARDAINHFIATIPEMDKKTKSRGLYAKALSTRASCSRDLGQKEVAVEDCNTAIGIYCQLMKEDPKNETIQKDLSSLIVMLKSCKEQSSNILQNV